MSLCLLVWLVGTPHSSACAPGPGPLSRGRVSFLVLGALRSAGPAQRSGPAGGPALQVCMALPLRSRPLPQAPSPEPRLPGALGSACPLSQEPPALMSGAQCRALCRFHVDAAFRRAHVGSLPACPSRRQRPRPKPPAGCARGRLASSPFLLRHRLLWASRGRGLSPSSYHLLSVWLTLPGQPSLAPRHGTRRRPRPPALPSLLPRSRTPVRPTLTPQPTARPRAVRALARLQG